MTAAAIPIAVRPAKIGGDEAVRCSRHESQKPLRHGHTMTEGQSSMRKLFSRCAEPFSERMRQALIDSARRQPGEPSEVWLRRCADACGLTERRARGIYYREAKQISAEEFERAQEAAASAIHREVADLKARLAALEKEIEDETHRAVARPASVPRTLAHDGS